MNPKVSILICHLNGEEIIDNCLKSLSKTDYPNYDIHILLNNTTDDSEEIIKKYKTKIYKSKVNLGFTGGFNYMIEKKLKNTDSKYIASINNDTEVEPNWLTELVGFAEKNNADVLQPKILAMRNKKMFEYAGAAGGFMDIYGYPFCRGRIFSVVEEDKGQYDAPTRIFWACGSCALFRKDLFDRIGLLDKDYFMYAEETDFCWRANLAGAKIYSVPSSVIYHWGHYSIEKERMTALREYYLHRNTLIMFFKNYSNESIKKLKFRRIFLEILSALVFLRTKLIPITKALYWIRKNKKTIKEKHDETQKLRKLSDAEIGKLMLDKSIVFQHFLKRKKKFSELNFGEENKLFLRKLFKIIVLGVSKSGTGKYLGKINLVKKIEKKFSQYFTPEFVILDGHKIYLDKEDALRLSTFGMENHEVLENKIYNKYIKEGDTIIDVGAFIGDNTLNFARLVGKNGKVYAFEPNKNNFHLLRKNIKVNNYKNVILINKAVSDKIREVKMKVHKFKSTGDMIDDTGTIKIGSVGLDSVINEKVDFLKIDVEGTEQLVIKGAKRIIKENKNLKMIIEIIPSKIENPFEYLKKFINSGFNVYNVDKEIQEIRTNEEINNFLRGYESNSSNLFLIKGGKNVVEIS